MARKDTLDMGELTDAAYYMLLALSLPNHGYQMMQDVMLISEGTFTIGPASLYTTLKKMLNAGLIQVESSESENKKSYSRTQKGFDMLYAEYSRKKNMVKHFESTMKEEG